MASQYETQLVSQYGQGMQDYINSQRGNYQGVMKGVTVDKQDVGRVTAGFQGWKPTGAATSTIPTLNDLAGQQYQFDPNKYLPGIQQTASSIYDPQRAQIQALQGLQTSQTEQARVRTKEDFAARLTQEKEAINARGAFFGGGALNRESNVGRDESYALQDINFQDQAAQAGFLAQQAGLSAAQAEYIQQKLSGAENSAYSRFNDERGFKLNLQQANQDQANADRQFNEDVRRYGLDYALEKKRVKIAEKNAKKSD